MRTLFPFLLLATLPLSAQTPYLVKDINTTYASSTKSSDPTNWMAFGDNVVFSATNDATGTELWKTDGTAAGTSIIADIIPGPGSSNPVPLAVANGLLFFDARDVDHGIELWATDGTSAGTHMVADISPGPTSSNPFGAVAFRDRLIFFADDGVHGRAPWISDGSASGTHMIKDFSRPNGSPSIGAPVLFGNAVYFPANGALWKTDGTDAGTVQALNVPAQTLRVVGSKLFFESYAADTGVEPWVTDGTVSGTHIVADINPGPKDSVNSVYEAFNFVPFGNQLLFLADDGVHGRELWITDGTAAGTHLVKDIVPGAKGAFDQAIFFSAILNGRAYFAANDPDHGMELWVTDGTDAGTHLFADLVPGPPSSSPYSFAVVGGQLLFAAGYGPLGASLWVSDGTVEGTHTLAPDTVGLGFAPVGIISVNGKAYFAGKNALNGTEPWATDGTAAGTHLIANLAPDNAPSAYPSGFTVARNLLFFYAVDGTSGGSTASLWRSDGTNGGTFKLRDFAPTGPEAMQPAGSFVFFKLDPYTSEFQMSDGTVAGTKSASNFQSTFGGAKIDTFFPLRDAVYVSAGQASMPTSLWRAPADLSAFPVQLPAYNPVGLMDFAGRKMFFGTTAPYSFDPGLWTTDGTPAGTYPILPDLGSENGKPSTPVIAAGTMYFLYPGSSTAQLWKSDGTFAGTSVVKQFNAIYPYDSPIKAAGRKVYFPADSQLWVSDGTAAGTIALMPVTIDSYDSKKALAAAGNRVVVLNHPSPNIYELWGSDGTVAGTKLLQTLGNFGAYPVAANGVVYFAGTDTQHGTELWTTDGTPEGTKFLFDINPGPASSNPEQFTQIGNLLYFSAYADTAGNELWVLPLTQPVLSIADARVVEGDSGTTMMHFVVSLSIAASQSVTVQYATSDGTATAGQDYDTASGTLTFAPGETTKSIDVAVHGDLTPESNETLFVSLTNANGASLDRAEAAGIIEDDDAVADISVVPQFTTNGGWLSGALKVANAGPSAATQIAVPIAIAPASSTGSPVCQSGCDVTQLSAGQSVLKPLQSSPSGYQAYYGVTATARQRDPNAANNSATWTVSKNDQIAMSPAFLTTGGTATVTARVGGITPAPVTSDATVLTVPSTVTAANGIVTFNVTGVKAGTATVDIGVGDPLQVTVVDPGTSPRWPGALSINSYLANTSVDRTAEIDVTPAGRSPVNGAAPTGTVVVTAGGREVARRTINGTAMMKILFYPSGSGILPYQVSYGGDANFLPQSVTGSTFIQKGNATITGILKPVSGAPGSFTLNVEVSGSPVVIPTGTVSVISQSAEIATAPLVSPVNGTSFATIALTKLPASPTLTLQYGGDLNYNAGSQQVRVITTHQRPARH